MKKLLMLVLVLCLCVCLAACDDDYDDDDDDDEDDKRTEASTPTPEELVENATPTPEGGPEIASMETWGDFTVGVPVGWTFRKGDAFDEDDTRYCSVKMSDFKYFDFKLESDELATQHYLYNKETYTNEQKIVSGTFGDISWDGFQYSDGWGGYGFELITTLDDGRRARVSSCGFQINSDEVALVLSTLRIASSDEDAE